MIIDWFKRKRQRPGIPLVVFGTEFGSYQFLQLVQCSRKYEVIAFISNDSWQQRSCFGKIGILTPEQLTSALTEKAIAAIVVTSDQREAFEKDDEMGPVRIQTDLVRHCEVLEIPQTPVADTADTFIDRLI
jgi:FlaA1/EpsC-like NDP-sugar epimerase